MFDIQPILKNFYIDVILFFNFPIMRYYQINFFLPISSLLVNRDQKVSCQFSRKVRWFLLDLSQSYCWIRSLMNKSSLLNPNFIIMISKSLNIPRIIHYSFSSNHIILLHCLIKISFNSFDCFSVHMLK